MTPAIEPRPLSDHEFAFGPYEPHHYLPAPDVIAAEIIEDLRAALATFEELQGALGER